MLSQPLVAENVWEDLNPEAFAALQNLAEAPLPTKLQTFTSSIAFTRLTAAAALKFQKTDAIFENIKLKDQKEHDGSVKRLSIDCKATVEMGDSSRNGKSRTQTKASDHDMGDKVKYIPCGILDEDSGALTHRFWQFCQNGVTSWWITSRTGGTQRQNWSRKR